MPSHPFHRPFRDFEVLEELVNNPALQAKPVKAVYMLERNLFGDGVVFDPLEGHKKFEGILSSYLFNFDFLARQRMSWLAGFLRLVPVFILRRPWGLDRQNGLYARLLEQARSLG